MIPVWAILNLVFIGVGAGAGIREAGRARGSHRDLDLDSLLARVRYLTPILAAAMVLLPIQFLLILLRARRPFLLWSMPAPVEQFIFPVLGWALLSVLSFIAGMAGTVALRGVHPRRWMTLAAAFLMVFTVATVQFGAGRPVVPDLGAPAYSRFMVYQTTGRTSAPAAGATIARALGLPRTEKDMAELFGTSSMGTSSAQVVRGMKRIGIHARKVQVPGGDIRQVNPPAMLLLTSPYGGPETQAAAYLGFVGGMARVWDPMEGLLELEPEGLARIWRGRAIECALETTSPRSKIQDPK